MKKYKGLICITLFLIAGIIVYGDIFKSQIKTVDTITLNPCTAKAFIVCTGKIEYANKQEIFLDSPCVVDDVCVNVGDRVSKGDTLLKVSQIDNNLGANMNEYYSDQNLQQVYSSIVKRGNFNVNSIPSKQFKKNTIVSPMSGVITNIQVANNLPADNNNSAITISNGENLSVLLNVNEAKISDVKVGQKVLVSGIGFKNREYIGIVRSISNEAKTGLTTTGQETTVEVIVDICKNENDTMIKPGFTAKCKILTEESKDTMIIPYETVKADDNGKEYVFVMCNGTAKQTYIKTGREYDYGFEVIDGINSDDIIITNPDLIKNNDRVRVE